MEETFPVEETTKKQNPKHMQLPYIYIDMRSGYTVQLWNLIGISSMHRLEPQKKNTFDLATIIS